MNRLRTYAQLVRLPNVFTALADISLGWVLALATGASWSATPRYLWLLFASACLYSAGMVWNDFFDVEEDRRDRPFRPIPSGRVPRRQAGLIGAVLLLVGIGCAALSCRTQEGWTAEPAVLAVILAAMILGYNAFFKHYWLGPLAMGTCRSLNILLGVTLVNPEDWPFGLRLHLALAVGVYITGVTWFARKEAGMSSPRSLALALLVMMLGLCLGIAIGAWFPPGTCFPLFPWALVALGFWIGSAGMQAVSLPRPAQVQRTVKRAILSLIVFDAILASAIAGLAGALLLLFLLPAAYLGRWIYST